MIVVNIWFGAPFFMIMYLAALKSVPEQLYEAAAIDGATAWQKLIYITLPMMRNIILITVLLQPDRHLRRLRHRAHPDQRRPAGQHASVRAPTRSSVGIQSGNIPRGAAVSLFMFPILATLRVLRAARRHRSAARRSRHDQRHGNRERASARKAKVGSLERQNALGAARQLSPR